MWWFKTNPKVVLECMLCLVNSLVVHERTSLLLKERRERKKLIIFYKIHHNIAPDFLVNILSPLKRENVRNLRNQNDYTLSNYRLESTRVSYFPSTIRLWNNLEFEIRNNFTFNQFKYYLNTLKMSIESLTISKLGNGKLISFLLNCEIHVVPYILTSFVLIL